MKAWTSATVPGRCAFDNTHTWKQDARIFRLQGPWGKPKDYCASCAVARHDAPPDTGEVLDLTDAVSYPTPLKMLAANVAERFDARMAAAGEKDEPDALFAEPFEEPPL